MAARPLCFSLSPLWSLRLAPRLSQPLSLSNNTLRFGRSAHFGTMAPPSDTRPVVISGPSGGNHGFLYIRNYSDNH